MTGRAGRVGQVRRVVIPCPGPVTGTVVLPGSKSDSARAIIAAALADGESILHGVSRSDDTSALLDALARIGVDLRRVVGAEGETGTWEVRGRGGSLVRGAESAGTPIELDVGLGGTNARFLLPVLAASPGVDVVLTGEPRLCERPMDELFRALRTLGADLEEVGAPESLPVRIRGRAMDGGRVVVSGRLSSQFVSGLLLAGSLFRHGLVIDWIEGRGSASYVEMTRSVLGRFGREVESRPAPNGREFRIAGGALSPTEYAVDGDASGASYFWALAAVTGGRIVVENLRHDTVQGDLRFVGALEAMGCRVELGREDGRDWVAVDGSQATLAAIDVDLSDLPDTAQTLAVVAAFAEGTSDLRGLHSLPYKETDRLAALTTELGRVGIDAQSDESTLRVVGGQPHGASIATYRDHRMAMSFAVLGARVPGVTIEDAGVVSKSMPDFWERLESVGVKSHARE